MDVADRHGEDVGITLAARLGADGATLRGRIVHDAKSSWIAARIANQNICFGKHERETGVLCKRAIAIHHHRSDREIAEELLANIVTAGFSFVARKKEVILAGFQSV